MQRRRLGRTGPTVSALGLGCMGMSVFYGESDDAASVRTIHHAIERGVTFFDTAELYGNGHNEELLGRAIRGKREGLVIATKFGIRLSDAGVTPANGTPGYVRAACEASLKRLGVECIDLYYQHRVDPHTPIEETVGAMAELVRAGKVKHLGLSEAAPGTIRRAQAVHPIAAVQTEYSLWTRDVEDQILPTCRELGIGFVPYSPLSRGFLSGAFHAASDVKRPKDTRTVMPRFADANFEHNKRIVERLSEIARAKGATVAQLAISWLLHQGDDIVPIPGTRRIGRLDENLGAASLALSRSDLDAIVAACPRDAAAGARLPERAMASVNL
ncbi:MAG: aldo/keto reductase [Rhodospirillaceae bacterium]|nr:aldo/keto reductase [Rhodospirillaceae bacterium]